jgi:methyl-accepting chemotaxis protein
LAIAVLAVGYVALLLLVQWTGSQTLAHMDIASGSLFPATLDSQEASAAFQKLTKSYSDAVLVLDQGALAQAGESAQAVTGALESVRRHTGFSPERQKQIAELLGRFTDLNSRSRTVYTAIIDNKGAMSDQTQASMATLAQDNQRMEASLHELRANLSRDFQDQLDGVVTWTHRQRVFGWALFLLVVSCAVWITVMVERRVSHPLERLTVRLKDIAEGEGDLTQRIPVTSEDEIGELSHWFNTFIEHLQNVMRQVIQGAEQLASASEEISASATQMAQGSETQQGQTQQIATAMQEMAASVAQVSTNSNQVATNAGHAANDARDGGRVVDRAVEMMHQVATAVGTVAQQVGELGRRSDQIGKIVGVIDEIADQTNLLALNAAIEAARAGEQGRGFAVVADEVRKLAERTTKATKEIAEMIHSIQQETKAAVMAMEEGTVQVEHGVVATKEAGVKLQQIIKGSEQAAQMITQIATAANEQASTTDQINSGINEIARISHESASGAKQSAKACEELSHLALDLQGLISRFKVREGETGQQRLRSGRNHPANHRNGTSVEPPSPRDYEFAGNTPVLYQ